MNIGYPNDEGYHEPRPSVLECMDLGTCRPYHRFIEDHRPRLQQCSVHRIGASFLHTALHCAFLGRQETRP